MKVAIINAFSINMLSGDNCLIFKKAQIEQIKRIINDDANEIFNFIGHKDLDNIIRKILPVLAGKRDNVCIDRFDQFIVAQYRGPRLPEGTTVLPEGAEIEFWLILKPVRSNIDDFDVWATDREDMDHLLKQLPY